VPYLPIELSSEFTKRKWVENKRSLQVHLLGFISSDFLNQSPLRKWIVYNVRKKMRFFSAKFK